MQIRVLVRRILSDTEPGCIPRLSFIVYVVEQLFSVCMTTFMAEQKSVRNLSL
jgi:hypothetical protein